jgi:hypothetical protein
VPFSINGEPYTIADGSARNLGRRTYRQKFRSSQSFEAAPITATWQLWGPMGNSRAYLGQQLALDYVEDLDHRFPFLLTSAPKKNSLTLSAITSTQTLVTASDITKTNWSEGAGDGDGSAFDELAVNDDAVGYWTTSTQGADLELKLGTPSPVPTSGVVVSAANFNINFRFAITASGDDLDDQRRRIKLLQGTTILYSDTTAAGFSASGSSTWQTHTVNLSQAVYDSITDWTDLRLLMDPVGLPAGSMWVSAMWMTVPDVSGGPIVTIDEDRGQIFVQRGLDSTKLNPSDMTETETITHDAFVTDSVPTFQGAGFVALGEGDVVQKRTTVTAGVDGAGAYTDVTGCEAFKMGLSDDRLWYIDAITDVGKAKFVVDDWVDTTDISNPLQVMDPSATHTGVYSDGDHLIAGFDRGANSFTNTGASEPLMESVKDFPSTANGASGDRKWGWFYIATGLGLYALNVDGGVENPVGPGEGQEGKAFEGPIDGYPTAVKSFKDSLWVAYLNPDGTTYVFRGLFGSQTASTGRPDWYMFRKFDSTTVNAFGGTSARDNPALLIGEDTPSSGANAVSYYTLSTRGREIADSNYEFGTDGGVAYGTTMTLPDGARANMRWAKFVTENCVASTDTWQLAVDVDDAASYIPIGSAVTSNGMNTVRPVSGTSPLATTTFNRIKPRLTQVASSESAPPQIRGDLTMAFDLRPDQVREINVVVELDNLGQLRDLETLVSDDTLTPVALRLPTDDGVNEDRFAYISELEVYDRTNPEDMVIELTIVEWGVS